MTEALQFHRSPARYLAARGTARAGLGPRLTTAVAVTVSPLRLVGTAAPPRPRPGWVRLRPLLSGICGSDLSLLSGHSSGYLGPLVSLPFTPGHEVVAETLDDTADLPAGSRVVVDPVLSCATRGLPRCPGCRSHRHSRCDGIAAGSLAAGLQTGFCADTGGGWSGELVAHPSQLHAVPDGLDDRRAVLVEPLACAVHAVRRVEVPAGAAVLLVGAGTVGLLTLLALRELTEAGPVYVVAKHRHQRERALALGATEVFGPKEAARAMRAAAGAHLARPELGPDFLLGGAELAFECTGGPGGLQLTLRLVRAGGTVVLAGMPSDGVDLTPVWFRELSLVGAYASGSGPAGPDGADRAADFPTALDLAGRAPLDGWVDAVYPLSRYREALGHALAAGRLGTVKVAFAPTTRPTARPTLRPVPGKEHPA